MLNLKDFIKKTWFLNRVTVGKDTEFTAKFIQREYGGDLHSFASGLDCLTWIIPPAWEVRQGLLIDPKGKKIVDFKDNPLYLCSYSAPFKGTVNLAELKKHLHTNEAAPKAIPYHYQWQYQYGEKKDWGFCLPFTVYQTLIDGEYKVNIAVSFKPGKMFVNDILLPGRKKETIVFCSHTCHPAMVNDGIANVALALELLKELRQKKGLKYSYRFILGPEYFAAAAWLSKFGVHNLKGGFYLDGLGNEETLGFSRSFSGRSWLDKVSKMAFDILVKHYYEYPYRGLYSNDEMFYDGPGFEIPFVCIGRGPWQAWREYHTSDDNYENCNFEHLAQAQELLLKIIKLIETDKRLAVQQKGPLYLSRFNNQIFLNKNITSNQIQEVQLFLAKQFSYVETAYELGLSFDSVRAIGDTFLKFNLAREIDI